MSSPLSSLKNKKSTPMNIGTRPAPYKPLNQTEDELIAQVLAHERGRQRQTSGPASVSNHDLGKSMMTRLTIVEKQLATSKELIREKDKRIKVLGEKCEIYKKAQGYGDSQVVELERKCHKLQKQIHSMESFLEDYGMIWVGTNNSSDDDDEENDDVINDVIDDFTNNKSVWNPELSYTSQTREFNMNYDLVLENINELNEVVGEGQHFIKYTKDGARLEVQEPVPLTLYQNGIFMFGGPFRPFEDKTTQLCMKDLTDGYFPSELQDIYPDGVPFKVTDKRDVIYRDKRKEKLFPGEGHSLSPKKSTQRNITENATYNEVPRENFLQKHIETNNSHVQRLTAENFLAKLPPSVIKNGKIVDIRDGIKVVLQDQPCKNNVIVVETDVVKDMKTRLSKGRRSRPQTPGNTTTLRIKSETGDHTYVLKMLYSQTIEDVRIYLDSLRDSSDYDYDLKTSFPSQTYGDMKKSLRDYGLVPNATLFGRMMFNAGENSNLPEKNPGYAPVYPTKYFNQDPRQKKK